MFRIVIFSYLIVNLFLVHLIVCNELRCVNPTCSEIIGRGYQALVKQKLNVDVYGILNEKQYLITSNNSPKILQKMLVLGFNQAVSNDKLISIKDSEANAIIGKFDAHYMKRSDPIKVGNSAKLNRTYVSQKPLTNSKCSIYDIFGLRNEGAKSFYNLTMCSAGSIVNFSAVGSNFTKSLNVKNQTTAANNSTRDTNFPINETNSSGAAKSVINSTAFDESAKNKLQPEHNSSLLVNETNGELAANAILYNQSIDDRQNRTKTPYVSLNSTGNLVGERNVTISGENRTADSDVFMTVDNVSEDKNEIETDRVQNTTKDYETETDLKLPQTITTSESPNAELDSLNRSVHVEETLNVSETTQFNISELSKEYTKELGREELESDYFISSVSELDAESEHIYSTTSSSDSIEEPVHDADFNEIVQDLNSINNDVKIENVEPIEFVPVTESVTETAETFSAKDFIDFKKDEPMCRASHTNDSSLEIVLNKLYDLLKNNLNESSMNLLLVLATTSVTIVVFLILSNYLFSRKTDYKFVKKFNEIERNYLKICQEKDRLEEQLFEKNNNYQNEYEAIQQQLCDSENERVKLKSELDQLKEVSRKALNKYTSERNKKNANIKQLKDELSSLESELRTITEEHIKCKEMTENLSSAKEALETALSATRERQSGEIAALVDEANEIRQEADRLREAHSQSERKFNAVTVELDLLKNKFCDENQSFFDTDLVLNNNELEAKSRLLSDENVQLLDQLKQLETDEKLAKQSLANLSSQKDLLNERLNQVVEENRNLLVKNQVLEVYFKDKESELQRQLEAQKALAAKKDGDSSEYLSELDLLKQENISLKHLISSMKQEHSESLKSHKSQCLSLEQKSDQYYLRVHNAERELEETRLEARQLRNILAEMSRGKFTSVIPTLNMNGGSVPSPPHQVPMNNVQNANHFTPIQTDDVSFNRTPEVSLSERNPKDDSASNVSKPASVTSNALSTSGELPSNMPFFMKPMGSQQQVLMSDQQRPSPLGRLSSPTPPTTLATVSQTHSPLTPSSSSFQSSQSMNQAHMPPSLINFAQFPLPPPHIFHQQFKHGDRLTPPPLAPLPPPPPLPLSTHPLDFRAAFSSTQRSLNRSSHSSSSDSLTGSSASESESPEVTSDQSYVDDSDAIF